MPIVLNLIIPLLWLSVSAFAAHGHNALEESDLTITMGEPPAWSDFNVGLSGDNGEGYDPQVVSLRQKESGNPKHSNSLKTNAVVRIDESKAKEDTSAAKVETSPFSSYLNCNGKDGWLTTQLDPTGKALSANFSPAYDASGKNGESIPLQMLGPDGNSVALNKDVQKQLTLGGKGNICGPAGGKLEAGDNPGQAGC